MRSRGSSRPAPAASPTRSGGGASSPTTASCETRRTCPGSGLLAFGSFAYADDPGHSVLVVPEVVVGRRGSAVVGHHDRPRNGVAAAALSPVDPPAPPVGPRSATAPLSGADWELVVADAVSRIKAGGSRRSCSPKELLADLDAPLDVRVRSPGSPASYPACWTFHVSGLFGSTPEMLVRRERGLVASRVLAGTIRRTGDDAHDLGLAATLARSSKNLEEHEFAVRSVAEALAPYCASMNVPEAPFVLHLPNVMHLATDVTGVLDDDASSLALAAALHPSAAVGGTPTARLSR